MSRGREELRLGTSFLLIIGSRMSGMDIFFLAVAAAKGNHRGIPSFMHCMAHSPDWEPGALDDSDHGI